MHRVLAAQVHPDPGSDDESGTGSPEESQAPTDSGSGSLEQSRSASPDIVLLGEGEEAPADAEEEEDDSDDKETLLQGTVSLLDISNSDNEETRKAAACEKACTKAMFGMLPGEMSRFTRVMMI